MRWIFRAFTLVAILAVLGVVAIALVPGKKLADIAAARIEQLTGREVTLQGDVTTKIFPRLSISTGPITISNADWAEAVPMLAAEGLNLGVELLPLIKGDIQFRDVEIIAPKVRLEVSKNGSKNWDFTAQTVQNVSSEIDGPSSEKSRKVTVDLARLTDGQFHYFNRATQQREELNKIDLEVRFPEVKGAVRVEVSGLYRGALLDGTARLDRPMDFLLGSIATVEAKGSLDGAKIVYSGKLGLSGLVMDGDVQATFSNTTALLDKLNINALSVDDDLSAKGQLVRTPDGTTYFRNGEIGVGTQVLRGDLDVKVGEVRPMIKGILSVQDLSIPELDIPKNSKVTQPAKVQNGWSSAPIDVSGLFAADAEISLSAGSLDFGAVQLGESQILLNLNAGRAVFDLRKSRAYGGDLTGEFVVNGRNGLSVGGNLSLTGAQTQQLFGALIDFDRFEGEGNIQAKFLGVGNNLGAIMKSIKGQGAINVESGVLTGVDVEEMIRNLNIGYQGNDRRTVFEKIDATFVVNNGVMTNDDLAFKAANLTADGHGKIDLGQQTLDYRLSPTAFLTQDDETSVRVPLIIRGPWSKPQYALDLEAIVDQEFSDEKAALEAKLRKARETAKADAAKKLGVTQEDGESLEDAARRTIEENAAKELKKLLGQN